MNAGILSLTLCSALLAVPDRPPIGGEITAGVESGWYQQLQRDGRVTIPILQGKIVVVAKQITNRTLMSPTIEVYNEEGPKWTFKAKQAELRFDAKQNVILLDLRDCTVEHVTIREREMGRFDSRICPIPLPKPKD
jgi:hypothetical protein